MVRTITRAASAGPLTDSLTTLQLTGSVFSAAMVLVAPPTMRAGRVLLAALAR